MRYRLMKKDDIEGVFSLGKPYFALKSEYSWDRSIEKIEQYLKKSFGIWMVCVDGNSIIGFVLVETDYSSQKPNVAWLTYIFVDEKYRHKNIASTLLDLMFEKLKHLGKTDIITDVYAHNKTSLDFFDSDKFHVKEKRITLSKKI